MLGPIVFWVFQIINLPTAIGMVLAPRKFHESMFKEPEKVYKEIGFSSTAVEMLHNVLRGQGAALLAISLALFYTGFASRASFLLIALTCGLSLIAHLATARHHLKSPVVMRALGNMRSMYVILLINAAVLCGALAAFFSVPQ